MAAMGGRWALIGGKRASNQRREKVGKEPKKPGDTNTDEHVNDRREAIMTHANSQVAVFDL
jgi:hypothetical protein